MTFTRDEAELYDRQIRLWGLNAQKQIRKSKILMLGFNGVASEVAKIVVLAGIDTLTIVDNQPLQPDDINSNLFCRPSSDGENKQFRTHAVVSKLNKLNPSVKIKLDNSPINTKTIQDFQNHDLVTLHSFMTIDEISHINDTCRASNIKFYVVLDFGFFGFMFNDLGSNFKYSYEEYSPPNNEIQLTNDVIKDDNYISIDGGEADHIDEPANDDLDDSDEDYGKPKKRRRLRSPPKEVAPKVGDNEKQTKIGQLSYATFKDVIPLEESVFNKSTSPALVLSVAMLKFYSKYKHLPQVEDCQSREDDLRKFNDIIRNLEEHSKIPAYVMKKLDEDWPKCIYGSLSPICAILGGVAGQDMIRALSNKDIPIFNFFSLDGINMSGSVAKLGISTKTVANQPIVRDTLQIDDSDED